MKWWRRFWVWLIGATMPEMGHKAVYEQLTSLLLRVTCEPEMAEELRGLPFVVKVGRGEQYDALYFVYFDKRYDTNDCVRWLEVAYGFKEKT